jgi:pyrroloquinoline quinone biosynthesis protein D
MNPATNDSRSTRAQRPAVRLGFRLQWEPAQGAHVLLYPEGMVKLNRAAGEILSRCNGERTIEEIVVDLERAFDKTGLNADVTAFLALAAKNGWVEIKHSRDGSDEGQPVHNV